MLFLLFFLLTKIFKPPIAMQRPNSHLFISMISASFQVSTLIHSTCEWRICKYTLRWKIAQDLKLTSEYGF